MKFWSWCVVLWFLCLLDDENKKKEWWERDPVG